MSENQANCQQDKYTSVATRTKQVASGNRNHISLRAVPTIVIAYTFCAPRDTQIPYAY